MSAYTQADAQAALVQLQTFTLPGATPLYTRYVANPV